MNKETVAALNRINRRFYSRHAEPFSRTRSRPWPGWQRVLETFDGMRFTVAAARPVPAILDVGCGNGRFLDFLKAQYRGPFDYLGLDASEKLLREARKLLRPTDDPDRGLRRLDLAGDGPPLLPTEGPFDLIVVFGLLHHIAGAEQRRRLLEQLAQRLAPDGLMAISFWQFGGDPRFHRRIIPWADHNRLSDEPVDVDELEPGDMLLSWGATTEGERDGLAPRRYCHYANPSEARQLVSSLELSELGSFRSDGRQGDLNLYFLLRALG